MLFEANTEVQLKAFGLDYVQKQEDQLHKKINYWLLVFS